MKALTTLLAVAGVMAPPFQYADACGYGFRSMHGVPVSENPPGSCPPAVRSERVARRKAKMKLRARRGRR